MRGAIAAGHEVTAQAGARILAEGGNAVDACIAAAFASWVAESPLTGPGRGRLHARAPRARPLDAVCSTSSSPRRVSARATPLARRDGRRRHRLRGQRHDPAVPHRPRVLCGPGHGCGARGGARRHTARCPGASSSSRRSSSHGDGVELTSAAGACFMRLLDSILRHAERRAGASTASGRRAARRGRPARPRRPRRHARADRQSRAATPSTGESSRARSSGHLQETGRRDHTGGSRRLPRHPAPRRSAFRYRTARLQSNPPPSSGGILIGYGLRLLEALGPPEAGPR